MDDATRHYQKRLVAGVAVLAIGVLFTSDHLGIVRAGELLHWWPLLLIALGVWRMAGIGTRRSVLWGALAVAAGSWQLLYDYGMVQPRLGDMWPVLLIVWGVAMILGRSGMVRIGVVRVERHRRAHQALDDATGAVPGGPPQPPPPPPPPSATGPGPGWRNPRSMFDDSSNHFSIDAVLSTVARRVTSQALAGGAVTAVMGSAELDLRQAAMANGAVRLETNIVMGGANITVPMDWQVEYHGSSILSSVDDFTARGATPRGRLVITGMVLMGTIVVRN